MHGPGRLKRPLLFWSCGSPFSASFVGVVVLHFNLRTLPEFDLTFKVHRSLMAEQGKRKSRYFVARLVITNLRSKTTLKCTILVDYTLRKRTFQYTFESTNIMRIPRGYYEINTVFLLFNNLYRGFDQLIPCSALKYPPESVNIAAQNT